MRSTDAPTPLLRPALAWSERERRLLLLVFVAALVLRVGTITVRGIDAPVVDGDPYYYSLTAEHLLEGRGYVELEARAYRPPGFVWFLAGVYSVAGVSPPAARLALALVGAAHCLLQAAWVRRLAGNRAGLIAATLTAVHPHFLAYPYTLMSEVLFIALQALTLWLLLDALQRRSWWGLAAAGATCGVSVLTRELGMAMIPAVGAWAWFARSRLPDRLGRRWLVFAVATMAVVAPWTARNYGVLGAVVPVSTSTGINLYIGNHPAASGRFEWVTAPGVSWDDGAHELAAHRQGVRAAIDHIRSHPGDTIRLALTKLWLLWRPPVYGFAGLGPLAAVTRAAYLAIYLALLLLPLCGWRIVRRHQDGAWLPGWLLILATAAHVASFAGTRFRVPLEALLVFYAALVLSIWWDRRAGPPLHR